MLSGDVRLFPFEGRDWLFGWQLEVCHLGAVTKKSLEACLPFTLRECWALWCEGNTVYRFDKWLQAGGPFLALLDSISVFNRDTGSYWKAVAWCLNRAKSCEANVKIFASLKSWKWMELGGKMGGAFWVGRMVYSLSAKLAIYGMYVEDCRQSFPPASSSWIVEES